MWKWLLSLVFLYGFGAQAQHLEFQQGLAWVTWEQGPTGANSSQFLLTFQKPSGEPVDVNGTVEVELYMPDMGHGSAPTQVEKIDAGIYRVSNVLFIMAGHWEIRVKVTSELGEETKIFTVDL